MAFSPTIQPIPSHELRADIMQYLLNIALFLPAGFLCPLIWETYGSLRKTAAFGFLLSLAVECSQLLCFRTTDLNDLLTNTLGAVLGWLLWRACGKTLGMRIGSPWQAAALVWTAVFLWGSYAADFLWGIVAYGG